MLTLEKVTREVGCMPGLAKAGVVGLVVSGLADVVAHLEESEVVGHVAGQVHQHNSTELSAHLAGFVSMVIVLAGVVVDGVRQQRARRGSSERTSKGAT
jgi:hypothetical protein